MKYSPRGTVTPVALWLFVSVTVAKLLSDGNLTPEAKVAVWIVAGSLVGGILIAVIAVIYGIVKRRKKQ